MKDWRELEDCILSGTMPDSVKFYHEIDAKRLAVQAPMFRASFLYATIDDTAAVVRASKEEVNQLFS